MDCETVFRNVATNSNVSLYIDNKHGIGHFVYYSGNIYENLPVNEYETSSSCPIQS